MEQESCLLLALPNALLGKVIQCVKIVNPKVYLRDWFAVLRTCKRLNAVALSRDGLFFELSWERDRPLRRAAQMGYDAYMARILRVMGPNVNGSNVSRALLTSAERGHTACINVICSSEHSKSFLKKSLLKRALWHASDRDDVASAQVLLRHTSASSDAALIHALKKESFHVASLLLQHATRNETFTAWFYDELVLLPEATRSFIYLHPCNTSVAVALLRVLNDPQLPTKTQPLYIGETVEIFDTSATIECQPNGLFFITDTKEGGIIIMGAPPMQPNQRYPLVDGALLQFGRPPGGLRCGFIVLDHQLESITL